MQELGDFISSTANVLDVHADTSNRRSHKRNKIDDANCEKDPVSAVIEESPDSSEDIAPDNVWRHCYDARESATENIPLFKKVRVKW